MFIFNAIYFQVWFLSPMARDLYYCCICLTICRRTDGISPRKKVCWQTDRQTDGKFLLGLFLGQQSLILFYSCILWIFTLCLLKLCLRDVWYGQMLQLYWGFSSEWYNFLCLVRYDFLMVLLQSVQTIFPLGWWTFICWEIEDFQDVW